MQKLKKINLSEEVISDVVEDLIKSVPGISKSFTPTIEINQDVVPHIKITIKPINDIVNIYNLCKQLQDLVYYHILNDFDLNKIRVDVVAV